MYTPNEIKKQFSGGKTKVESNAIVVEPNKKYKLWIPKAEFCGIKRHFRVRNVPTCASCKVNAINCINQEDDSKKCEICEHIKSLWKKFNNTTGKAKKDKIYQEINGFTTTYFYVNVIDIADKELKFQELTLTSGAMKELNAILLDTEQPISDFIFTYKKSVVDGRTKYTIIESESPKVTDKLNSQLESLIERPFEDGGPNPLEDIHRYDTDEVKYNNFLTGKTVKKDDDDETVDELVEDTDDGGSGLDIDEDENLDTEDKSDEDDDIDTDIDDLDMGTEDKSDDDDLDLGDDDTDLSLDDDDDDLNMDLDDEEEAVTMINITKDYIKENKDDKQQMLRIIKFLGKKIKTEAKHGKNVNAVYAYVKSNPFDIPETELLAPEF